jgi:hypothetical protein
VEQKLMILESEQDFLGFATRARANDLRAYLKLCKLASLTNSISKDATHVVDGINQQLEAERASPSFTTLVWKEGDKAYSGPFTSDEIALFFDVTLDAKAREAMANAVRNPPQPLFIGRLVQMLTNEDNLLVADRISLVLSELTKEGFRASDPEKVTSWWESRKGSYTNWPFVEMKGGLGAFHLAQYSNAAAKFEKVLKVDPTADLSRAHAIFCYWETGDSNRATTLANGFKYPAARWAQAATAKAEIQTGGVSNGTVHLVTIATNYPSLLGSVRYHDVWRKADWGLFEQFKSGTNRQASSLKN